MTNRSYSEHVRERAPKYHKDRKEFRVVSFPNRQWQSQEIVKGRWPDPDCWIGLHRPTDLATALQQRDAHAARLGG